MTLVFVNNFIEDANSSLLRFYYIKLSPTLQIRRDGVNYYIQRK